MEIVGGTSKDEDRAPDRWMFVNTGFGSYLGKVEAIHEVNRDGRSGIGGPVLCGDELELSAVVRIESLNLPTRDGNIAVQPIPSGVLPWLPPFAREGRIRIPLARIVWYADVDEEAVAGLRTSLLATTARRQ